MELTALKRLCEHWGDRTPYLDLRTMIDAIDQFRERAELLELAVREGNEEEARTSAIVSDLMRDLSRNLLSYGSYVLQQVFIEEVVATCGVDRVKQVVEAKEQPAGLTLVHSYDLGDLDDHPF